MEYQLTAELVSPPGAPDLDPLQQVGVMSLLDERLNHLVSIEGPDDVEIIPGSTTPSKRISAALW